MTENKWSEYDKQVLDSWTWKEWLIENNINHEFDRTYNGYRVKGEDFPEFCNNIGTNAGGENQTRLLFFEDSKTMLDWSDSNTPKNGSTYKVYNIIQIHSIRNNIDYNQASRDLGQKKGLPLPQDKPKKRTTLLEYHINQDIKRLEEPGYKLIKDYLIKRGLYNPKFKNYVLGYNAELKRVTFAFLDEHGIPVYAKYRRLEKEEYFKLYPNATEEQFKDYEKYGKYTSPSPKKFGEKNLNKTIPFNYYYSVTHLDSNEIYLVEGIPDSLTLSSNGINNLCVGTAKMDSKKWNKYFLPVLEHYRDKQVIICGDNDDAGKNGSISWIKDYLFKNGFINISIEIVPRSIKEINLKNPYQSHFLTDAEVEKLYPVVEDRLKDINEVWEKTKSLDGFRNTRIDCFTYFALICRDKDNKTCFKQFRKKVLKPYYCNLPQYRIDTIIEELKDKAIFTDIEIGKLESFINRPPSQTQIVNNIKKKYRLLYDPSKPKDEKFYQFNGKVWKQIYPENIETMIGNEFGDRFDDGNKYNALLKKIRSNKDIINNNTEFNKNLNVLVFPNGTLYLGDTEETTIFRENYFNPDDLATFMFNADYNPSATAPRFYSFLMDSLEAYDVDKNVDHTETELKFKLLQDFTGYTLFDNNDLEKLLISIGEGGNGKTIFFEIIEALFDSNSYGTKTITKFEKDHSWNYLDGKRFNISSESQSSLYGVETLIKSLVSGEKITDDPKFQKDVTFRNKAKLFISGNNEFTVRDRRHSFLRRLIFIEWNNIYTDDEKELKKDNPKIKESDTTIKSYVIKNELSGVFNWILEGYFRLKKNGKFILTKEHERWIEEFKLNNNPIRIFLQEYLWADRLYNKDGSYCYVAYLDKLFQDFNDFKNGNEYKKFEIKYKTFRNEIIKQFEDFDVEYDYKKSRSRIKKGSTRRFKFDKEIENIFDCFIFYENNNNNSSTYTL